MGVLRGRRRPDRPGHAGTRPAGLDLGHDRCPRPAVNPALDRAAGAAGVPGRARIGVVLAPDRQVDDEDIAELAGWIQLYKRHRALIHSGRVVRIDTADDTAWMHGVVAADQSAALLSYVQLDEPRNDQPAALRVQGLDPRRRYQVSDVTPGPRRPRRRGRQEARSPGVQVSGAALAEIGLAIAPQRTLTAAVVLVEAL